VTSVRGLQGFVADLLREIHGFTSTHEIKRASDAVATHAENTVNLLGQGFSGVPDVSFLPIYYALLNVSKIYVILRGRQSELEHQRLHGASYNPKSSRDLMTEEVKLHDKGAIPLFLNTITNQTIAAKGHPIPIKMKDIYPFIRSISHEFSQAYKKEEIYYPIEINVAGDEKKVYWLKADITANTHLQNPSTKYIKVLDGFNLVPNIQKTKKGNIFNKTGINSYRTKFIKSSKEKAQRYLFTKYLKRYLLSAGMMNGRPIAITPISDRKLILPEELPILLAFHHMSNVVRYNPEMLEQLKDSKAWTLLLTFIRHGTLSFLELSWSAIQQKHIKLVISINDK
jgi:hypothetical protein